MGVQGGLCGRVSVLSALLCVQKNLLGLGVLAGGYTLFASFFYWFWNHALEVGSCYKQCSPGPKADCTSSCPVCRWHCSTGSIWLPT